MGYTRHLNINPSVWTLLKLQPFLLVFTKKVSNFFLHVPRSGQRELMIFPSQFMCSTTTCPRHRMHCTWYISRYEALTRYCSSWVCEMWVNICSKELRMTPFSSGLARFPGKKKLLQMEGGERLSGLPSIVYVFPVPVWPYAKIVPR